jgi:hypothetical protein
VPVLALAFLPVSARGAIVVGTSDSLRAEREAKTPPVLEVTPGALDAEAVRGKPVALQLTVRNAGGQQLRWSANVDREDMALDVAEGVLGHKEARVITVAAQIKGRLREDARGNVTITSSGAAGSPVVIPVTLRVPAPRESPDRAGGYRDGGSASESGFGIRIGYAVPAEGDTESFGGGPAAGVSYRRGRRGAAMRYEVGIDVITSDSEWAQTASSLLFAGAAACYRPRRDGGFYLLGGGRLATEQTSVSDAGDTIAAAVDVGGGMTLGGGKLDVRATWSVFVGSGNVPGFGVIQLGYAF